MLCNCMNIDTVKANVSNVDLYDPQFIKNENITKWENSKHKMHALEEI